MPSPLANLTDSRQRGFSLIEILVALVIAMAGTTAMLQVFSVSEGFRRVTSGGGNLQTSGAIALYAMQRDIRQAGLVTARPEVAACRLMLRDAVAVAELAPVTINPADIPAGDPNTDILLVTFGRGQTLPDGDAIILHQAGSSLYTVAVPSSFMRGQVVVPIPPQRVEPCSLRLSRVESVSMPSPPTVTTLASEPASMADGRLFNLGADPAILAYAVRGGRLTVCDFIASDCSDAASTSDAAVWVPVANHIVSLRAQYGVDTGASRDGVVDSYQRMRAATPCGIGRVLALRLALVGRNEQFERDQVTAEAPTWSGSDAAPISLSHLDQWRHFRYRTYETSIPLRNAILASAESAC